MGKGNPSGEDILSFLPHGPEFRFIDRILNIEPGIRVDAVFGISSDSPYIASICRFYPYWPQTLILESMVQTSGLLLEMGSLAFLAAVPAATFHAPVRIGESLLLKAERIGSFGKLHSFRGEAHGKGLIVAEGEIVLAANFDQGTAGIQHMPE